MGLLIRLLIYGTACKDFGWAVSYMPVHGKNNHQGIFKQNGVQNVPL